MSHSAIAASALWCATVIAIPAGAQGRAVTLTGQPQAALDEPFTAITGMHEVALGKVVLSDMSEQRLILGDFTSNAVRSIGRKGGGPGEWQLAMNVMPGPSGTVYVADPSLRKVHVVDAAGKIVRTIAFPGSDGASNPGTVVLNIPRGSDALGRLYGLGSPFVMGQREQPDSVPILRWDPRTKRTDTLGMIKNEVRVTQGGRPGSNTRVMARIGGGPLSPTTMWRPMGDGRVAIVNPTPYRVDVLGAAGQVRRGVAVPYSPVKIGKAERDAERARLAAAPGMTISTSGGAVTRIVAGGPSGLPAIPDSDFPAVMPPFTGQNAVVTTPEGEIWVLRTRAAADKVPTYDIFDANGRLVGKATLNPHSTIVGFGAGTAYVARKDPEDDLVYLERFRR